MDKKLFSTKIVDKSWVYSQLEQIKTEVRQKIGAIQDISVKTKSDKSLVTEVDYFICNLIRKTFINELENTNYFSEEDQGLFKFPMIILDPMDGTNELVEGIGECAVSFGIYYSSDLSDTRNYSWIYNPFTGMEISSETPQLNYAKDTIEKNLLMISRTEFKKGLFKQVKNAQIFPIGSIAYKLMLLSYGVGNAVISKRPKNIWDIMAGTHIAFKRGIQLYNNGEVLSHLDRKIYEPDLFWSKSTPKDFHI